MSVRVRIMDGALGPPRPAQALDAEFGAVLSFDGIVRAGEDGRTIRALAYEAYEPMASNILEEVARAMIAAHGVISVDVEHSRGEVPVGGCSFRITVHARHRAEAIAALGDFIDRMKRDVPIWKSPVWA